jgi:hypothetical protein
MDDVDCYFINSFALQLCDFDGNIDEFAEWVDIIQFFKLTLIKA